MNTFRSKRTSISKRRFGHDFAGVLLILASLPVLAAEPVSIDAKLHGFADTVAGRDGRIVRVTNLQPAGKGSLKSALQAKGPRIVVFEVGGVLDLEGKSLRIVEPFLTIAGQTAPSPGITIVRGSLSIRTHDVLVQHIRVRPGDNEQPKKSGWQTDGINVVGGQARDVVIDHCSVSWATDENLSVSGPPTEGPDATAHKATISHCFIVEGLSHSTHTDGKHSKGSLIHDFCRDIAIIGNLYAHNSRRNPYFKAHTTGVIVNNVIYNPASAAIQLGNSPKEPTQAADSSHNSRVSIVGNVLIHGANTKPELALVSRRGDAYMDDNLAYDQQGGKAPLVSGEIVKLQDKPNWPDGLQPLSATDVVHYVVQHAGARPRDRDETDKRIANDLLFGKGRIIDSQEDVGGYPKSPMVQRTLTVPAQNVDKWLQELAKQLE